jgi:2-polyprenyl-6-methoxyphenol hydroxylase-like FAD-dependent oxidoreductase
MCSAPPESADDAALDVLIAGGGPFGLMLANELGRRDVSAAVFDAKPSTAFNPQANATQARTMEHYRRLGFADEVRRLGLPADFPTDVAYFTRFATHELARFRLPSAREARESVAKLSGSWSAAELPHRVAQKYVEQVLRRHAEELPSVSINYGWRLTDFVETEQAVTATLTRVEGDATRRVTARYLVGADGARSHVRKRLGIGWSGETGVVRDFFGGRMYAIYLESPQFYEVVPHPPAWMNVTFNRDRRAFMAAVDGKGRFAFHTQLREGEEGDRITEADGVGLFRAAAGARIDATILACDTWTAGHALVAERFQRGRILLGGDAAHLFTPAGGLGYNTAIEDAVNLGWKLAAAVKGVAGGRLLESYELERRPAAVRNTGYARGFAESLGRFVPKEGLEDDGPRGERLRREAGEYLEKHGRAEFNIPGITFGTRYAASPVIAYDGSRAPPDSANSYEPSASPGGRAPHLWLDEDRSLFDAFGFEWTLLRLGPAPPPGGRLIGAARRLGIELEVVDVPQKQARDLYEAPLALIRPDQVVAWRGSNDTDADAVAALAVGHTVDDRKSPSRSRSRARRSSRSPSWSGLALRESETSSDRSERQ